MEDEICPAGKIKCKKYEHLTDIEVQRDTHPSNHRCWALKRAYYIHDFEVCPFPSKQIIKKINLNNKQK